MYFFQDSSCKLSIKINLLLLGVFLCNSKSFFISHLNAFVLGSVGGAKVFEGASDKQVMAYFKQLTGSKLPKPVAKKFKVGDNKFAKFFI
jgi:hypothetical protein